MDSITLSGTEFKALASDTRTSIIKILKERNHTLSELSKRMNLAAPTVKQHLGVLEGAALVEQVDEGRKWKYYCLTRKGKKIFGSEQPTNILLLLAASFFGLIAVMYSFMNFLRGYESVNFLAKPLEGAGRTAAEEMAPAIGNEIEKTAADSLGSTMQAEIQQTIVATQPIPIPLESILVGTIVVIVISVVLGFAIARLKPCWLVR
ncbi:MAG: winged helix-turn-helix transcriptional regulator [Candidatus Diapherotrites archaeon]|nr:winged helix-turn-helix transcriptional regulator [Candidatus Diapherotrites archaeon]